MSTGPCVVKQALGLALLSLPMLCPAQYFVNGLNLSNSPGIDRFDAQHVILDQIPPPGSNYLAIGPSTGLYTIRSNGRVTVRDHFELSCLPGANSSNRAIIGSNNQLLNAVLLDGTYTGQQQYETMEWGIDLSTVSMPPFPKKLQERILEFLNDDDDGVADYKPGTPGYDLAFKNGDIINPYDPAHISVDALFYRPSNPHTAPTIRYGFYKGTNDYDLRDPGSKGEWPNNMWEATPSTHPWRVRFAPDEVGQWTGFINIWLGPQNDGLGSRKVWETYGFEFNVINTTGEEGYIVVSANRPDYLAYHANGRVFVPCGQNYGWPKEYWGGCQGIHCANGDDHRMRPSARAELGMFIHGGGSGTGFSQDPNGVQTGNTTRTFFTPWGFMVERERLGNYSTRDVEMDELDRYFKVLERYGMKTWLSTGEIELKDGAGASAGGPGNYNYNEGWWWNPYHDFTGDPLDQNQDDPNKDYKGIDGVTSPDKLTTDPTAIRFYKNRLRYIDARWGHSKALLGYDWNEVDLSGLWYENDDPSTNNTGPYYQDFRNWLGQLTCYMKQDLKTKRLISIGLSSVRMATDPDALAKVDIYRLPCVDVASDHVYGNGEGMDRVAAQHLRWLRDRNPPITKPFLVEESGTWVYEAVNSCSDLKLHNSAWSNALSGMAGPPISWPWRRYTLPFVTSDWQPWSQSNDPPLYLAGGPYHGEYEWNYSGLRAFLEEMDGANNSYRYYNAGAFQGSLTNTMFDGGQNGSRQYEVYSAVRSDRRVAYGWVHNRSSLATNYGGPCCNQVANNSSGDPLLNMWDVRNVEPLSGNDLPQSTANHCIEQSGCTGVELPDCNTIANVLYDEPICNNSYDQQGYVTATGWPADVYDIHPGANDLVAVYGLQPSSIYYLRWVDTWGVNCGNTSINPVIGLTSNNFGRVLIEPPPTGPVPGKGIYPGDWAFRLSTDPRIREKTVESTFGAYMDLTGIRVHFDDPFTGELSVYDASGRQLVRGFLMRDATEGTIPVKVASGIYCIRAVDPHGTTRATKIYIEM